MSLGWKDWNRSDVIYGIVVPLVVVLVIVGLSMVTPFLMRQGGFESMGIVIGILSEIEEIVIIVAIPLLLGLVWNRWAGGTSGFLLGSIYAMWWYVKYSSYAGAGGFSRGALGGFAPMLLGWVLTAMLTGYMAGALNKRSENFKRMIIVGVISATAGGLLLFWLLQLSPSNVVDGLDGFLLTVLSRTAAGVIIPIIAKVFMWYGVAMNRKPNPGF